MFVLNKISPAVELLDINNEHEAVDVLMDSYGLNFKLAILISFVFSMSPKLIARNSATVATSDLYKDSNMVASIISGKNGVDLVLGIRQGDNNHYIVDFIDVIDGTVRFAVHRLKDSVVDNEVRSIIRPGTIDSLLKDL